jgi:hypothetical protein
LEVAAVREINSWEFSDYYSGFTLIAQDLVCVQLRLVLASETLLETTQRNGWIYNTFELCSMMLFLVMLHILMRENDNPR